MPCNECNDKGTKRVGPDQNGRFYRLGCECKKPIHCDDCGESYDVPFDNGDGKTRCAACAVDKYMKSPGSGVSIGKGLINLDITR